MVNVSGAKYADAPPPNPNARMPVGAALPPPSEFDSPVMVTASARQDGSGTAFAIHSEGYWLTAKHAVAGCETVRLHIRSNAYIESQDIRLHPDYDLALIKADYAPDPVSLDLRSDLIVGSEGYFVGFPKGAPGEAAGLLHKRSNLQSSGPRRTKDSVIVWTELGRTSGIGPSLAGISGGPVYDQAGQVRGLVLAESPRRGRIYSAAPHTIKAFLDDQGLDIQGTPAGAFTTRTYGAASDRVRRHGQVVKLACQTSP